MKLQSAEIQTDALPTPIARCVLRLQRLPQGGSVDSAYLPLRYLFESMVKTWSTAAVAALHSYPADASRYISELYSASSIGAWVQVLRSAAVRPRNWEDGLKPLRIFLTKKRRNDDDIALTLKDGYDHLHLLGETRSSVSYQSSVLGLLEFLVLMRNRGPGAHGAQGSTDALALATLLDRALSTILSDFPTSTFFLAAPQHDSTEPPEERTFKLVGNSPIIHSAPDGLYPDKQELVVVAGDSGSIRAPGLIRFDGDRERCFCANGQAANDSAQFIDYASGDMLSMPVAPEVLRGDKLPESETAGTSFLVKAKTTLHNLPANPTRYISRLTLEEKLVRLVSDRMHRMLVVRGPGGAGKTTLTLRVLHHLASMEDFPFDYVLWLSARDVDLTSRAVKWVRREVSNWDSILDRVTALLLGLDDEKVDEDSRKVVLEELKLGAGSKYLLVLDNFETMDDPRSLYRSLDESVAFPSKVLITTRSAQFEGDTIIAVGGLDEQEAMDLIGQEARQRMCEPLVSSEQAKREVIQISSGLPYQIKVTVGLLAKGHKAGQLRFALSSTEDVLRALFERSFAAMTKDGQHAFMLLATIGRPVATIVLEIATTWSTIEAGGEPYANLCAGIYECSEFSLTEPIDLGNGLSAHVLSVPAIEYGRGLLRSHPDALEVDSLVSNVRELSRLVSDPSGPEELVNRLATAASSRELSLESAIEALMAVGLSYPETLETIAYKMEMFAPVEATRDAYQTALESGVGSLFTLLKNFAYFNLENNEPVAALAYLVRAIESAPTDMKLVSDLANDCNRLIVKLKDRVVPTRRRLYTRVIIQEMVKFEEAGVLDGDGYARLAWTYLQNVSATVPDKQDWIDRARKAASDGLSLDPDNKHCLNVLNRIGDW